MRRITARRGFGGRFPLLGDIRIDAPRLHHVGCSAGFVALFVLGDTPTAERVGKVWIELDRLVEVPNGEVVLAFAGIRITAIVECRGEAISDVPVGLDKGGTSVDLLVIRWTTFQPAPIDLLLS